MRRWWNRLFVLIILLVAAGAVYAVWPDEPDRYFPDWMNLPSGRGVPSKIAGVELPCHEDQSTQGTETNDAANCKGMRLGLDLQGGIRLTLEPDLRGQTDINIDEALDRSRDIIERRINPFGVSESQVQRAGDSRLVVELPGVSSETARDITRPAQLMFCEPLQQGGSQGPAGSLVAVSPQASTVYYKPGTCEPDVDANGGVAVAGPDGNPQVNADGTVVRITPQYTPYTAGATPISSLIWTPAEGELNGARVAMTGQFLKSDSQVTQQGQFGGIALVFNMTKDGSKVFGALTDRMQGTDTTSGLPLATFLDGEPVRGTNDEIIAPTVNSQITDTGQISGLDESEAKRLSTLLNNGAFPIPLRIVAEQEVDATLGDKAVEQSVEAGIVAMMLVMVFMILYYRLPGVLASLALAIYAAVVLAIFKIGLPGIGPVTLTLAGVAGFVLSVGMAVDANILIFERMREELRNGRSLIPAVEAGFDRAWSSIRDSNIATMITCGILYWMGNSFGSTLIKGFALTLAIGVVVSLFSAITVSRTFLRMTLGTPLARWMPLWTDDRGDDGTGVISLPTAAEVADA